MVDIRIVQRRYERKKGSPIIWWIFIPSLLALPMRIAWQFFPTGPIASLFWFVMFVDEPFRLCRRTFLGKLASVPILIGAVMNGLVTIANNGKMPGTSIDRPLSIWTPSTEASKFLWLGDNYAGFSVGDFCLIAGGLFILALALATPLAEQKAAIAKASPQAR